MFIQNKYTECYNAIIARASTKAGPRLEGHHIIPKSFYIQCRTKSRTGWLPGNPNDPANIIYLTIREHRLCHILLVKMTSGPAQHKMIKAAALMINSRAAKYGLSKGKCYEKIKLQCAELSRSYVASDETRAKLRAAHLGKKRSAEQIENMKKAQGDKTLRAERANRKHSLETKEKMRLAAQGRKDSPETTENRRSAALGRKHSPETKERMRLAAIARHASK